MTQVKKLSLSHLGIYNPQRMTDEAVEQLFIAHKKVFQLLIGRINREQLNSIPQHYLIIALRGMGKSTLLKRIEVELRKEGYKEQFVPLLFPEEQYNLSNLSELWLNSLDALADTLEVEGHHDFVARIDKKVREFVSIDKEEELSKATFQFFNQLTQELGRRPVLLIDNLNLVFDRIADKEQHQLRAILMKNNAPILIGASAVSIEDTHNYGKAFYDAFQMYHLPKLSFEQLLEILEELARLTDSKDILPSIRQEIGRLKTIHHLTGGNPRTTMILFKLIVKGFSAELNDDLEALLDEITPLYKARFEALSVQQQKIVDAIALFWDPINLGDLRKQTRFENNQLSPQLKRLVEVGWIETLKAYKAKGKAYQISERFFNIWFLMRRSSRRQKRELLCLSKFLESFFGEHLPRIARNRLQLQAYSADHIAYNLAMAEVVKDASLKWKLKDKSFLDIKRLSSINPLILKQFDVSELARDESFNKSIKQYIKSIENKNYNIAEKFLLAALEIKSSSLIFCELGNLYKNHLNRYEESEKLYKEALKLNTDLVYAWNSLANLYQYQLAKYDESENAYRNAITIDGKFFHSWNGLGNLYQYYLGNYSESEKAYKKALELNPKYSHAWNGLGNLYQGYFKKYKKAEEAYLKAIAIDTNYLFPKFNLVFLYRDRLDKIENAKKLFYEIGNFEEVEDSYQLNKALFALYEKNEGIASNELQVALKKIGNHLPPYTKDDWMRFAAIVLKLNYAHWLLNIMEQNGYNIILSPYYTAIKALSEKDKIGYLNSKAVEIREPAKKIMEWIEKYS